jgi:anti-sigma-K factor RskA
MPLADPDLLAGEYVLGVTEPNERAEVERRAAADPAFAIAIRVWERRLGPLHELIPPVAPPAPIWPAVAQRLDAIPQPARAHRAISRAVTEISEGLGSTAQAVLVRRLRRWRMAAVLAAAVAVSLAAFLLAQALRHSEPAPQLSATLKPDGNVTMSVTLDPRTRTLTVRPSDLPPQGRAYQLWLVSGEKPVALARTRGEASFQPDALRRITRNQLREATVAVSLEPADAPPPERPTGAFLMSGRFAQ